MSDLASRWWVLLVETAFRGECTECMEANPGSTALWATFCASLSGIFGL